MKTLFVLGLLVLGGCVSGRTVTHVTSYGDANLAREVVFVADQASIHEIELMKRCAKGVASVGVKVLKEDCGDCIRVKLKTETAAQQVQAASGGVTTGFSYGVPGFVLTNSSPVGTVTVITKKAQITLIQKGREVHGMSLSAKSRNDNLLTAIESMCAAGFKNFPESLDDEPVVIRK